MNINLANKSKDDLTRYLIGFAHGSVKGSMEIFEVPEITTEVLKRIEDIFNSSAHYCLSLLRLSHPGIEAHHIDVQLDPTGTHLQIGFTPDSGVWEKAPYSAEWVLTAATKGKLQ